MDSYNMADNASLQNRITFLQQYQQIVESTIDSNFVSDNVLLQFKPLSPGQPALSMPLRDLLLQSGLNKAYCTFLCDIVLVIQEEITALQELSQINNQPQ